MRSLSSVLVLIAALASSATAEASVTTSDLGPILRADGRLASVIEDSAARRFQVLATTLTPSTGGALQMKRYGFRVDAEYTYAASALKPAAAIAALERVQYENQRHGTAIRLKTPMHVSPAFADEALSKTSLALAIRKVLIVSSNPRGVHQAI